MLELAGFVLLAFAVSVYSSAVWFFASPGRGTPLPFAPPREFVVAGPYRHTRNPMAVSVVSGVAGLSLLLSAPVGVLLAAALAVVLHRYNTTTEEPKLSERFGQPYDEYCRHVPRWLPRVCA